MDMLLRRDFVFRPEDGRKNVLLPFCAEREYDRLAVLLHYGPKAVTDPAVIGPQIAKCVERYFPKGHELTAADMKEFRQLLNFITLSVDHNGVYVGCAHRHPPAQKIVISAAGSSWGFAAQAAERGDWRVVLHVQAVVAGTVDCHVAVYGLERGESDDLLPSV